MAKCEYENDSPINVVNVVTVVYTIKFVKGVMVTTSNNRC